MATPPLLCEDPVKFFHQLLLASVALGLAAPTMATAAGDDYEASMDDEMYPTSKVEVKSRLDLGVFGGGDEVTDEDGASLLAGYKTTISLLFSSTGEDSLEVGLVNTDTVDSTSYFIDESYEWASDGSGDQGIELDKLLYSFPALTEGVTLMVGGLLDDTDILDGAGLAYGGVGFDGFDSPTTSLTGFGGGFQYSPSGGLDGLTWSVAYVAENGTIEQPTFDIFWFNPDHPNANEDGLVVEQNNKGGLFGEDTSKIVSTSLVYNWAVSDKQDASLSVVYQKPSLAGESANFWTLLGSVQVNPYITLSGSFLTANLDGEDDSWQRYNIGAHLDDLFMDGNSGGLFYGTAMHGTGDGDPDPLSVVELYYNLQVTDNLEIPVFIDFINNIADTQESGWSIGVRPTIKF